MFTNLFNRLPKFYLKSTSSKAMSDEQKNEFYKIPSTPLKAKNSLQVFTRSQCSNQCSANCLVHKKRKRRTKAEINESNLDLNLNFSEIGLIDQSKDGEEFTYESTNPTTTSTSSINLSTSSINLPSSSKRMAPKRRAAVTSSRFSNLSKLSDDENIEDENIEDESKVVNNVNRYNYYESFSFVDATRSFTNQNLTGRSTYTFLIGLIIVFIASIYFLSTSQLNSIINFDTANYSLFKMERKLNAAADQLKFENNGRAIELFRQELKQSFYNLNERIDRIENKLIDHIKIQQEMNKKLIDTSNKLDKKLMKRTDDIVTEWINYKEKINKFMNEFSLKLNSQHECQKTSEFNLNQISQLIKNTLDKYDADKTGIVDYASEYAGGEVVSTGCTENYDLKGASYKILGVPIWSPPNIPRFVIQPTSSPGQCWYFKGNRGSLVIKLSRTILPSNFSYEHTPVRNAPDGHINSAPKHFEVRALDSPEADDNWLLGEFEYDKNGDPIQFFKFNNTDKPIEYIEFNILDNHGNEEFTCLYRIRVHGIKS